MKYYIVSEEELYKDIKTYINHGLGNMDAELLTSAILKSKQPVDDIEKENIELKSKLAIKEEDIIDIVKKITIEYLGTDCLNKTASRYFKQIAKEILNKIGG